MEGAYVGDQTPIFVEYWCFCDIFIMLNIIWYNGIEICRCDNIIHIYDVGVSKQIF